MTSTSTIGRASAGSATRMARSGRRTAARGFTLVEILVVVGIIALLATLIIPNFLHAKQTSDVAASQANLKEIATAIELYDNDNQSYPASGDVTPALFANGTNPSTYYLQAAPNSPGTGGGKYVYTTDGNGNYTITDPATYQQGTITSVESATAAGGNATDGGAHCTKSCQHVGYANTVGQFGY